MTVDLTAGTGVGGDAQGDTLLQMERVIGSIYADTLTYTGSLYHTLQGGAGNDVYVVTAYTVDNVRPGASIVEASGGGIDEVRVAYSALSIANVAEVENLTYTGTVAFTGTGNTLNNVITGGAGNDILDGGAGADQLVGNGGTDTASYRSASTGVMLNFVTGINAGDAAGDTYNSIEAYRGSSFNDLFVAGSSSDIMDGFAGIDIVSYRSAGSGVGINLATLTHTGFAAGDAFTSIEGFEGSGFADTLSGNSGNNIFAGLTGGDTIDGKEGVDAIWYLDSTEAVTINLGTAAFSGGSAAGDVVSNVEDVIGTSFADVITGNAGANRLEGGWGNDTLAGGDGNDVIFGGLGSDVGAGTVATPSSTIQADIISGGGGSDTITSSGDDSGTVIHGDLGADTILVASAIAFGDDGNDNLSGFGPNYELNGGSGDDIFNMNNLGYAFGGEGSDTYYIKSLGESVLIHDTGTQGTDRVHIGNVGSFDDVVAQQRGNDLYITSKADDLDASFSSGVLLFDWFNGSNSIELFYAANGDAFSF